MTLSSYSPLILLIFHWLFSGQPRADRLPFTLFPFQEQMLRDSRGDQTDESRLQP